MLQCIGLLCEPAVQFFPVYQNVICTFWYMDLPGISGAAHWRWADDEPVPAGGAAAPSGRAGCRGPSSSSLLARACCFQRAGGPLPWSWSPGRTSTLWSPLASAAQLDAAPASPGSAPDPPGERKWGPVVKLSGKTLFLADFLLLTRTLR